MVDLPPSRRDITTAPRKDGIIDLSPAVRHHDSYLESLDPGILRGRFATPRPTGKGTPLLVGGDAGGDGPDRLWEYDDRGTVIHATGTQVFRLSHEPIEESLFVRWHPDGRGGVPVTSEFFTVDEQNVIITDPGVLAVGDVFSFQYEYEDSEDALELEVIGCAVGVYTYPANVLTFTLPAGTQAGDLLIVACRGSVAPGGGDITLGATTTDSRISHIYTATLPVAENVFAGFADASTSDVVLSITVNPSYLPGAGGVLAVFRGANSIGAIGSSESGGSTPQVASPGAIAVTWDGNSAFAFVHAVPPSSYTDNGCDTGFGYSATGISSWFDAAADISPAGTFVGEGVLIIGVT